MSAIIVVISSTLLAAWLLGRSLPEALQRSGVIRTNFRGEAIAPALGPVVALSAVAGYSMLAVIIPNNIENHAVFIGVIVSAFVGLLDDIACRDSGKGFRGHLGRSISSLAASTGVLKAGFVSLAAVVVARSVYGSPWEVLLRACSIALTTNLLNLLDLRPGRCIKVYLAISALAALIGGLAVLKYGPVVVAALMVFQADLKGQAMLGDCGSNLLGFAAGCQIALSAQTWFVAVWLSFVLVLNVASEKYSFTSVIESNRILRWLDMLGRIED